MAENSRRLVLASGSPRRRELLSRMGYAFEILTADVDEHTDEQAEQAVATLARRKAEAVAERLCGDAVVIASDTLVSADGCPLGKPVDGNDAKAMLEKLSNREHEVFTGVCVIDVRSGRTETRVDRTGVTFRALTEHEIDEYIATGEPMDKAGAYAIQGGAGKFVSKLDGSFENVMGFPVDVADEMLKSFGF